MSLKKVVAIAFVALVMLFLFSTLVMAVDWPTNPKGPKDPQLEHPWDDVTRLVPGHSYDPWPVPALYEHVWDEVKRIDPKELEHTWEEAKRLEHQPWEE